MQKRKLYFILLKTAKNLNVKAFNLISKTNEARHIEWHETCKCKCRLDANFNDNRQRWSDYKCKF